MTLERIWDAHRSGATPAELEPLAGTARELFYLAVLADDRAAAAALAARAAKLDPDSAVYAETARYLARPAADDPYEDPEPFTAFATGGGNVGLYRNTHEVLRSVYAELGSVRLLDIGTGEGHALLPALTPEVVEVDVVEPSAARLARVAAELERRGITHRAHTRTVQEFTAQASSLSWDLVQDTFALLALTRAERVELFKWLRPRTKQLALVEFDVPDLGSGRDPRRFEHLVDRYEQGIREYHDTRELVAQRFLVPVLLGTLAEDDGPAHTEQPIAHWLEDLASAGFTPLEPRWVFDYWWAPAHLIRAT
ncbi:class I SAM-dependent methyltransferase [Saccharothrix obliqua]|uniref:class I SAM-dependent methyltransferase n=1 Tax=Saccharothrix obliqua TaxID=2861747 RepID=UPI001C5D34D1|nr:class I SAM-dependent methyltransferase [Saccharothrix obliqua]MBW4721906.1 class I SAM-dependent methyltransferase [Saccharothrix obliqua]